jgi:histidine triad (HIT) family protein
MPRGARRGRAAAAAPRRNRRGHHVLDRGWRTAYQRTGSKILREDGCVAECLFCEIARGERAAHVVFGDDAVVAFLDARPVFKGHALLIPRAHVPTLADLPVSLVGPVFARAKQLAAAMESGLGAGGSFVAVNNRVSQSVAHLHVHVVPRNRGDGLRGFFWPRTKYDSDDEALEYAGRVRAAMRG